MIGFNCKSVNLHPAWVIFAALLLTACSQPLVKSVPQEPVAVPAPLEPEPDASVLPDQPAPPQEELSASLLYGVLLGEIAGQRGRLDVSGAMVANTTMLRLKNQ